MILIFCNLLGLSYDLDFGLYLESSGMTRFSYALVIFMVMEDGLALLSGWLRCVLGLISLSLSLARLDLSRRELFLLWTLWVDLVFG